MSAAVQTGADQVPRSFAALYRGEFGFVRRALRCLGVPERSLDDAAQDVFVVVHRRLPDFEGRASLRTWIYAIVRRIAWRYRTRAQRDDARRGQLPEVRAGVDLDAELDRETAMRILAAFVDDLDEGRATVFVLAELGELPGREIAASLDLNVNTVSARLRSARIELGRLAHRIRAREQRVLLDPVRGDVGGRRAQRRTWVALSAKLGLGAPAAGLIGAGWGWAVGWGLVGAAIGGAVISGAVAVGRPEPTRVRVDPVARGSAAETTETTVASPAAVVPPVEVGEPFEPVSPPVPTEPSKAADEPGSTRTSRPGPPLAAATSAPTLSEEVEALRAVRAVVGHDDDALDRAVAEFRLRFEDSPLRPEVEALAVEHACRRGQPDAVVRLRAFAATWPNPGLQARLRRYCSEVE